MSQDPYQLIDKTDWVILWCDNGQILIKLYSIESVEIDFEVNCDVEVRTCAGACHNVPCEDREMALRVLGALTNIQWGRFPADLGDPRVERDDKPKLRAK